MIAALVLGLLTPAPALARQRTACPPDGWTVDRLGALKSEKFAVADAATRHSLAVALAECLGDPNPALRDGVAFAALSAWMRAGALDRPTLIALRDRLLVMLTGDDPQGFRRPFAALVLADVARTDRISAWLSTEERDVLVQAAARFLTGIRDYRAFSNTEGFRHGVAHGADFALQLSLNQAVTKPQLDRLLAAIAAQVAPLAAVSYTAGEPDRLARPVLFIAQRGLHSDEEWQAWFARLLSPAPMGTWDEAFTSELGLSRRHNLRAFLLSLYASVNGDENSGLRQLLTPVRDGLQRLP